MSAVVSRFAAKEFRALLPVWAASAVTVLITARPGAVPSTVTVKSDESSLTWPTLSLARAAKI